MHSHWSTTLLSCCPSWLSYLGEMTFWWSGEVSERKGFPLHFKVISIPLGTVFFFRRYLQFNLFPIRACKCTPKLFMVITTMIYWQRYGSPTWLKYDLTWFCIKLHRKRYREFLIDHLVQTRQVVDPYCYWNTEYSSSVVDSIIQLLSHFSLGSETKNPKNPSSGFLFSSQSTQSCGSCFEFQFIWLWNRSSKTPKFKRLR